MMKKIIFSQIIFLLCLGVFSGCKKRTESYLGPEYGAAPSSFTLLSSIEAFNISKASGFSTGIPQTTVNIFSNYQYYKATFSDRVSWKLTISSWKSKGVKTFTGIGTSIDETNTKWDGGSDNEYFFGFSGTSDTVEVKLSFVGSDLILRDTIRVNNMKDYHDVTLNGVYHYLVDDFDGGNTLTTFSAFYPDLDDLNGGNTGNNAYNGVKNQGSFSYRMLGNDVNNNTYLGSCNTPTLNDIPAGKITVTDPENLFINMYIYGTGKPNTTVSVIVYENDANQATGTVFNQAINDKLIYQIGVNWTGWKLVSFRYSGFRKPNTGGGLGNNRLNPEKITGLALELDSYPTPGYEVEAFVDMMVLTENGVFQK